MTRSSRAKGRPLGRVIYDIAQVLESVETSDDRLRRALQLLQWIVPANVCALIESRPGEPPGRIVVVPEVCPEEEAALRATLDGLLADFVAERQRGRAGALAARPSSTGGTLAVPIISFGEVNGILFAQRDDGAYCERHLRALAIVAGQLAAYLSMLRIHEENRARARDLDEARRAALASDRAKDELLAVMSAELKDPISSTLAWAHILVAARADPQGPALAVAAIERNARSLAKLIDDIQALPCVASAELRLDLRAIEPARVLKAAIEGLRAPAMRKSPRIEPDAGSSPRWLSVEPAQLGPVISSVVASATQISPVGGGVAVLLDRADTGVAEAAPRAREPLHALEGIRVLFVDDDPDIREAFQWVLEHYGAQVTTAESAAEALAVLERARPDVLLCDLGMPGENGYDLMRKVTERQADLPAAALTAFGELADHTRALDAGFMMQLAKPIEAGALVAAVISLVNTRIAMGAPRHKSGSP